MKYTYTVYTNNGVRLREYRALSLALNYARREMSAYILANEEWQVYTPFEDRKLLFNSEGMAVGYITRKPPQQ